MNYFISDLHFGHVNCLAFDNRPFGTIESHDNFIISKWNDTVELEDDVYILGDISWYNTTKTLEILDQLNGLKHLIIGNHDKKLLKNKDIRSKFVEITNYRELSYPDGKITVLSHYPIPCFNQHYYGSYHLYGHVHSGFEWNMMEHVKKQMEELYDTPCKMFNVGAMMMYMNYTPRTLEEIVEGYNQWNGTGTK